MKVHEFGKEESKNKRAKKNYCVGKFFYLYNWLAILPEGIKNVYTGQGRFTKNNSPRILNKVIEQNGKLIVNLVISNVESKEASDCKGKLISHFLCTTSRWSRLDIKYSRRVCTNYFQSEQH